MPENINIAMDESLFKDRANKSINRMLDCLFKEQEKSCKNCHDVHVCSFLTEAVFAYRNQYSKKYHPTL